MDAKALDVYPIGKAKLPEAFDMDAVKEAIETLAALPAELREAVAGCRDLDHPIREGAWSIRQLVHHLADSHMNAYVRTKLALTEDAPTVKPYDEVAWSRLADSRLDVEPALVLLGALHVRWVTLLRSLGQAEFERVWLMPERGARPVWALPIVYAWHGRHHTAQIVRAREAFGV